MKTLVKFFFIMAIISLAAGCNNKGNQISDESVELKSAQAHTVNIGFEANLLGELISFDTEDTDCADEGYMGRVIVKATGDVPHMGKVSATFDFCGAGPENPNLPTPNGTYGGFILELTAANGDTLYLSSDGGAVITGRLDRHPDHVYEYWGGKITVLGGTGKFEGAKGELTEDDYNSTLDHYTHHRFLGIITLVKGKGK